MTSKKQPNTKSAEETQNQSSNSPCCSPEGMAEMVKKFCGSEKGNLDCSSLMQTCCGTEESH